MNTSDLTEQYAKQIKGVLQCFDRLVLFGTYKTIGWPGAMGRHLQERGVRLLVPDELLATVVVAHHPGFSVADDGTEGERASDVKVSGLL